MNMPVSSSAWKQAVATLAMGVNALVPAKLSGAILQFLHGVKRPVLGLFGALCLTSYGAAALRLMYHFGCKDIAVSRTDDLHVVQMNCRRFCCRWESMVRLTQQAPVSCGIAFSRTCCCTVPATSSGPSPAAQWRLSGSALPRPLRTGMC